MDVDRLAELFGSKPEERNPPPWQDWSANLAGHIPRNGETVEDDGLRFEVLESTDRKVERVRITGGAARQLKLI